MLQRILTRTRRRPDDARRSAHARDSIMKKYLPALVWYEPFEPFGYAFIRFGAGAVLAAHGVGRLFYGVSTAELGVLKGLSASTIGGFQLPARVLLALGLLTRPLAPLFGLGTLPI